MDGARRVDDVPLLVPREVAERSDVASARWRRQGAGKRREGEVAGAEDSERRHKGGAGSRRMKEEGRRARNGVTSVGVAEDIGRAQRGSRDIGSGAGRRPSRGARPLARRDNEECITFREGECGEDRGRELGRGRP